MTNRRPGRPPTSHSARETAGLNAAPEILWRGGISNAHLVTVEEVRT